MAAEALMRASPEGHAGRHVTVEPSILCLGAPVALISTPNEDGTANVAPISFAWWLGWRCMLGLQTALQIPQNMIRTRQFVLNPPAPRQADAIDRLARLTGTETVPELKQKLGYADEPRKLEVAGRARETLFEPAS